MDLTEIFLKLAEAKKRLDQIQKLLDQANAEIDQAMREMAKEPEQAPGITLDQAKRIIASNGMPYGQISRAILAQMRKVIYTKLAEPEKISAADLQDLTHRKDAIELLLSVKNHRME